jgi:nicotinamide phosphoribosyltransferase
MNPILISDAYKYTHHLQYPPTMTHMYSYGESRRGGDHDYCKWFGLQAILKAGFLTPFTAADIEEAEAELTAVFGHGDYFNRAGFEHILTEHGGRWPVRIDALPEGTIVPAGNALFTIQNTDPAVPWLTNFLETALLRVWYPTTVATVSYAIKQTLEKYATLTGGTLSPFALNDFGYRGVSSEESAGLGGMAHLTNFKGTDTLAGIRAARQYYGATDFVGGSVMAAEHSTVTAWGPDSEEAAYGAILAAGPDNAIVSIVSDSYDIDHAVRHLYGNTLKQQILDRSGVLVVRPDSGDPATMSLRVLEELWRAFGGTTNQHGYRTLDPHTRVIYGDGIDGQTIAGILHTITSAPHNFSTDNIVFGMGGALLQQPHRDTLRFACKASAIRHQGSQHWHPVSKTVASDPSKASKAGIFSVEPHTTLGLHTVQRPSGTSPAANMLEIVYVNGRMIRDQSWASVQT